MRTLQCLFFLFFLFFFPILRFWPNCMYVVVFTNVVREEFAVRPYYFLGFSIRIQVQWKGIIFFSYLRILVPLFTTISFLFNNQAFSCWSSFDLQDVVKFSLTFCLLPCLLGTGVVCSVKLVCLIGRPALLPSLSC